MPFHEVARDNQVAVNAEFAQPKEPRLYEIYQLFKAMGLLREFYRLYPP
jgi:hypothetical protein